MITTIDAAGRVVVPKPIREQAGLLPGAELEVEYRDGKVEMEPVKVQPKLVRKGSLWVLRAPGMPRLTTRQVNRTIREIREERTRKML